MLSSLQPFAQWGQLGGDPNDQLIAQINAGSNGGFFPTQIKRVTTQFDAVTGTTGATLTNLVGLTGFDVQVGEYIYEAHLGTVATANSGLKLGFKLTTAVLGAIEYNALGIAAAGLVCSRGTTATDQASQLASTTAILQAKLSGRFTVTTAGTIALQAAQNAAHADTTSVFVGSWMRLQRIA